jgi:hypothetical protein
LQVRPGKQPRAQEESIFAGKKHAPKQRPKSKGSQHHGRNDDAVHCTFKPQKSANAKKALAQAGYDFLLEDDHKVSAPDYYYLS